jgi:hypothetical protein
MLSLLMPSPFQYNKLASLMSSGFTSKVISQSEPLDSAHGLY